MKKNKLVIIVCIIVLPIIAWTLFGIINSNKSLSLSNDILSNYDFGKLETITILESDTVPNSQLIELSKDDSYEIIDYLDLIKLKPSKEKITSIHEDYILSISGSEGSFRLYLSKKGVISISNNFDKSYEFIDKNTLIEFLEIIQHMAEQN